MLGNHQRLGNHFGFSHRPEDHAARQFLPLWSYFPPHRWHSVGEGEAMTTGTKPNQPAEQDCQKVLTVCQPFASAIIIGVKRVENRTWSTAYRGRLLIHAGKSTKWMRLWADPMPSDPIPFGAIIGSVLLLGCVHVDDFPFPEGHSWKWLETHEHTIGPWCWVLSDPIRFEKPIPAKGALGLWEYGN